MTAYEAEALQGLADICSSALNSGLSQNGYGYEYIYIYIYIYLKMDISSVKRRYDARPARGVTLHSGRLWSAITWQGKHRSQTSKDISIQKCTVQWQEP